MLSPFLVQPEHLVSGNGEPGPHSRSRAVRAMVLLHEEHLRRFRPHLEAESHPPAAINASGYVVVVAKSPARNLGCN